MSPTACIGARHITDVDGFLHLACAKKREGRASNPEGRKVKGKPGTAVVNGKSLKRENVTPIEKKRGKS
jgi:hypothetical protein